MEHSVKMPEMYGQYNHTVFQKNAKIYEPKAMYYCNLSACVTV